jgi:hypothetical protein
MATNISGFFEFVVVVEAVFRGSTSLARFRFRSTLGTINGGQSQPMQILTVLPRRSFI